MRNDFFFHLKAFADDKIERLKKLFILKRFLNRIDSVVIKGEKTSYHHFLIFPHLFSKLFFHENLRWFGKGEEPIQTVHEYRSSLIQIIYASLQILCNQTSYSKKTVISMHK